MAGIVFGKVNLDRRNHSIGNCRETCVDITLDNSYPTGGYALTPAQLQVDWLLHYVHAMPTTTGHVFAYNYATSKLMAFSAGSEVANTTDLSAVVVRVVAHGKGSPA